jgi:hypothetical protein
MSREETVHVMNQIVSLFESVKSFQDTKIKSSNTEPQKKIYSGNDGGGGVYTLEVTDETSYMLSYVKNGITKTNSGGAIRTGGTGYMLQPSGGGPVISAGINPDGLSTIAGQITWSDGTTESISMVLIPAGGSGGEGANTEGIIDSSSNTYLLLNELIYASIQLIQNVSFSLPMQRTIRLGRDRQAIELCCELYGSVDYLDKFIIENDFNIDEIELLPMGREVTYYVKSA